jgi:hypothetical protein
MGKAKRKFERPVRDVWGVIRYAPGSGDFCEDDAAGFDGWYSDPADAQAQADDWAKRFPQWIVAVVKADNVWWGDGDFHVARNSPLTVREFELARMTVTENLS